MVMVTHYLENCNGHYNLKWTVLAAFNESMQVFKNTLLFQHLYKCQCERIQTEVRCVKVLGTLPVMLSSCSISAEPESRQCGRSLSEVTIFTDTLIQLGQNSLALNARLLQK